MYPKSHVCSSEEEEFTALEQWKQDLELALSSLGHFLPLHYTCSGVKDVYGMDE